MPSSPEFRYRIRDIRIVKVFFKVESCHPPHPDGHIRIGGKVQIDLEHVHKDAKPEPKRRDAIELRELLREQRICDLSTRIGKYRFFHKACRKSINPVPYL